MKKTNTIITAFFLTLGLITFNNQANAQNVGINSTGANPNPSAMLDVSATDKGILIPRINIPNLAAAAPVTNPVISTLVYNTNTGTGVGYHYWNGTEWIKMVTNRSAWNLTGNTGTTASNFLGTTDNNSLALRTNNLERMRVLADGRVAVNSTLPITGTVFNSFAGGTDRAIIGDAVDGEGVRGQSDNGDGVVGLVTGTGDAVYGQNTGSGNGVRGLSDHTDGYGISGVNINSTGTAAMFIGQNAPSAYSFPGGEGIAVNAGSTGVLAIAQDSDGWGIKSSGNNLSTLSSLTEGGGGAFTGEQWGVYGVQNATIGNRAAFVGHYEGTTSQHSIYVGAVVGGTEYKIMGTGGSSVSTTMPTRDGERILFAPEAPENWFFDLGEVQLVNGKATVDLDPLFVDCISDAKPFKVFIQGGENTLGSIRVSRNQEDKTFTVEDLGGESDGIVQYKVYGIWKNKEDLRFPRYEKPSNVQHIQLKSERNNEKLKEVKKAD